MCDRSHAPIRSPPAWKQCFLLNTTATFAGGEADGYGGVHRVIGDATESDMMRFAAPLLLGDSRDIEGFRHSFEKVMSTQA